MIFFLVFTLLKKLLVTHKFKLSYKHTFEDLIKFTFMRQL